MFFQSEANLLHYFRTVPLLNPVPRAHHVAVEFLHLYFLAKDPDAGDETLQVIEFRFSIVLIAGC